MDSDYVRTLKKFGGVDIYFEQKKKLKFSKNNVSVY